MEKPTPKHELIILSTGTPYSVVIAVATLDTKQWILREAPNFGSIEPLGEIPHTYFFSLSPIFDPSEVYSYLMSFVQGEVVKNEVEPVIPSIPEKRPRKRPRRSET